MEKSSGSKVKPEAREFYCHLCSISCASALNLQTHFLGAKHKKVEEAVKNYKKEKDETTKREPDLTTLQEHIDACKDSEPAVGLEYIYQYKKPTYSIYECKLCECRSGMTHMFMHVVGAKHRLNYLCKHHPKLDTFGPYIPTGSKKIAKLKEICINVEKEFGRQKINVLEGFQRWGYDLNGGSSLNYDPDSELNQMDYTSDDVFGTSKKPKVSEHITFLELKAAHEADERAASSSGVVAHNTGESEEVKPINDTEQEITVTEESRGDTDEEEVPSEEPCESNQDFTRNEDLLDYLEHFRIVEIDDATFLIKAVEILSIALIQYQSEKMLCVPLSDDEEEQKSQKQDLAPSVVPPKQDPKTQCKKPLFPISKPSEIEPLSQRNKLMFTLSSNKAQESDATSSFNPTTNIFGKKVQDAQVNRETPSATTFTPSSAQSPPGPAPPGPAPPGSAPPGPAPPVFPIPKDDIVKTFFESIKNMEVAEVVTTLNKITTTNPAFKGIHVPSLVRYLTETGKLKSAKSVQQQNQ
ncbi:uncharacterized protein LOC143782267 [Ranitomeya variabilis]|uniref:uncharacterized protein LOC143782267 n=1 Tax=Ranitomeya variabilis TaxID=490064 RepID=UPI0040570C69